MISTSSTISIITITFNSSLTIFDCLKSVSSQTYKNIEHIIIDGGSTDSTMKIVESFYPKLNHAISEPDKGIYDAMNKGLARSSGDVICFLNSDDFYSHSEVLTFVAQLFEETSTLDACYADLTYVDRTDASRVVRYWQSNPFVPGAFSEGWCPPHPTFFVRRSVYERFGIFDLNYCIAADVELMMRFLEIYKIRVRYIPGVWVTMRMGGTTNKSIRNILVQNKEVLRALKNHGLPTNPMWFFANKLWLRGKQFMQRPVE